MAFGFLKKSKGEAPPDVGKEEEYESEKAEEVEKSGKEAETEEDEENRELPPPEPKEESEKERGAEEAKGKGIDESRFEIEKLNAKVEAISTWVKEFYERFSGISERIGEIRAMNLENEKEISKAIRESARAVDIVKEVKPERLRLDYKKLDLKVNTLAEKLESNKQFADTIMNELKELKRKASIFVGTDSLLRLNEEVKKDLIEIQKLNAKIKMHADKAEQIFIELRRGFAENQKINEVVSNLDASYSGLKKEIEKLKLDYSNVVSKQDFDDFKKTFNNKFAIVEGYISDLDNEKKRMEETTHLIETTLAIAKQNKEDIANIAVTIGDDKIKRVSDYENQLTAILRIIDTLAGQIVKIKKKIGMVETKISVEHGRKNFFGKNKLKLKHVEVHPEISKQLISKKPEIPKTIKEFKKKIENKAEERKEAGEEVEEFKKEKEVGELVKTTKKEKGEKVKEKKKKAIKPKRIKNLFKKVRVVKKKKGMRKKGRLRTNKEK